MCKLVGDYYAPVLPSSDRDLVESVMAEFHASALGGHLAFGKMYR